MTEMVEVVIKMPKEKYDSICNKYGTFPAEMKEWGLEYIKNGTVLPKRHGRLIDTNEITAFMELECNDRNVESLDEFTTIVEAEIDEWAEDADKVRDDKEKEL